MPTALRPELEPLPERIARLPIDERGYPVPWFVPWLANGKPEFRAMDVVRWARAVRERKCWICGEPLGRNMAFTIGPMCCISRTTAEPPSHRECATWAARNCPFLARPHARRREDEITNNEPLVADSAGIALARNPGVACVWVTGTYTTFRAPFGNQASQNGGFLIEMGEPYAVEFFAQGRAATRDEVLASIESGFPSLDAICDRDLDPDASRRVLRDARAAVAKWYPKS